MPIIQNYSDKHKPKIVLFSALYIAAVATVIVLLFNLLFRTREDSTPMTESVASKNICFDKDVEQYIVDRVDSWTLENEEFRTVEKNTVPHCDIRIERNLDDPNDLRKLSDTTYALAATQQVGLPQNLTTQQLVEALVSQSVSNFTLVWNLTTDSFLRSNFNIGVGQIVLSDEEIDKRLDENGYIVVADLDTLKDNMILIPVEQQSPLSKNFNSAKYPLIDRYWIGGENEDEIDLIYGILVEKTETEQ